MKNIKIKNNFNYPWIEAELIEAGFQRDKLHKIHTRSLLESDFLLFIEAKQNYIRLIKTKMINYFKDKTSNDFKN
jgi:hypothetical protein